MTASVRIPLWARLAIIAVTTVVIQLTAVSQIQLLGSSADLTPLVVAAVGLLLGSVPGACMGFAMGLFLDTALLQTMGVNALLYTAIGYVAGRFREARDPSHGLTPVAVGAAATLLATVGFSLMQFLLGVDAPVSLELLSDIVATVIVNAVLALPVYVLVRRVLLPFLPEDPRRRRRRAYTTGGLTPISRA